MGLPRGIAWKLALLFLTIGLVPMGTVGIFAYYKAEGPLTRSKAKYFVAREAQNTAALLDKVIRVADRDITLLAVSLGREASTLTDAASGTDEAADSALQIQISLNDSLLNMRHVDLLAVTDAKGHIVATSNIARHPKTGRFANSKPSDLRLLWDDDPFANPLRGKDFSNRSWWIDAAKGTMIGWHVQDLITESYGYEPFLDEDTDADEKSRKKNPESFSFGITSPIPDPTATTYRNAGVLIAFYNWSAIQDELDKINNEFHELHPRYRSGYTFLFGADRDTIIAHKFRTNYGTSLVDDHKLSKLKETMDNAVDGHGVCEYTYRAPKISGVALVPRTSWWIGFGIDKEDLFADVEDLRNWLIISSCLLSGIIVILIAFVARRVTRPIVSLIEQTNEIARGNLSARVEIMSTDEIAVLGDSFNKMAEDLRVSNSRLIQAEKAAAWKEMARQVAHEIKNPLTPIRLSAQLIRRAKSDDHPEFDQLLEDGLTTILSQTESLKKIAGDFANFAVLPRADIEPHSPIELIEDVTRLYLHQSNDNISVEVAHDLPQGTQISVDGDEFKRVLLNLINNALEAMNEKGGTLTLSTAYLSDPEEPSVKIILEDTGCGITPEAQARLFEPYFTTRTSGTGLGLAIVKKTIDSYDGIITISSEWGKGTTVTIQLPSIPSSSHDLGDAQ